MMIQMKNKQLKKLIHKLKFNLKNYFNKIFNLKIIKLLKINKHHLKNRFSKYSYLNKFNNQNKLNKKIILPNLKLKRMQMTKNIYLMIVMKKIMKN